MNGGAQPFFILSLPIRRTVNLFHSLWQGLYTCHFLKKQLLFRRTFLLLLTLVLLPLLTWLLLLRAAADYQEMEEPETLEDIKERRRIDAIVE